VIHHLDPDGPLVAVRPYQDRHDMTGFLRRYRPRFWIADQNVGEASGPNREVHVAFRAKDRGAVQAFYDTALDQGAQSLHAPRLWPEYHPGYYGVFLRDPDGNNVEAVNHTF